MAPPSLVQTWTWFSPREFRAVGIELKMMPPTGNDVLGRRRHRHQQGRRQWLSPNIPLHILSPGMQPASRGSTNRSSPQPSPQSPSPATQARRPRPPSAARHSVASRRPEASRKLGHPKKAEATRPAEQEAVEGRRPASTPTLPSKRRIRRPEPPPHLHARRRRRHASVVREAGSPRPPPRCTPARGRP